MCLPPILPRPSTRSPPETSDKGWDLLHLQLAGVELGLPPEEADERHEKLRQAMLGVKLLLVLDDLWCVKKKKGQKREKKKKGRCRCMWTRVATSVTEKSFFFFVWFPGKPSTRRSSTLWTRRRARRC